MSIQLQFRRGNTAQTAVFTGAVAELTVDTDKNTVILHDGVTAGGYALARESSLSANQALAQNAFNKANAAYDAANTKYNSSGGTISGNVVVTGNVSPTNTANNIANAFNQANLAYDAANTAYTAGGARAFDQANLAFDKANSAWDYANSAYATANNEIVTRQANVGAAVISITSAYEANVGSGLIANKLASDANVGEAVINVTLAYQSNVGAARIADVASSQANVGAAVISITGAYESNVGAGLISLNSSVTSAYQANVGAARIADVASGQANVGAGLITVTSAYQANVGAARIISLGRADSAFAQANLAFDAANNVAPQIQPTRDVANSAFAQANLAYAAANSKLSSSGGTISGDLSVSGNLTITGNTTTINVSSLKVTDTIIQLGVDNQTDVLDIGFIGHYANTPNNHTGLIRKYTDGRYYLFDSWKPGTEPTNIVDIANTRVATLSANLITNVITLRGLDPLDYANTIQTASQANVGAARIADQTSSQANVGSAIAQGQANVGAGLISTKSAYESNVGAGLITVTSAYQANVGAGLISLNTSLTSAYQANVGAGLISNKLASDANVGSAIAQGQANVGAGLITVTSAYQANVGAGLISAKSTSEANVGSGLITKVAKAGDTMTGTLSTSGSLIGSSVTANTILTVNTNSVYEATAVTTGSLSQIVLDSFSTTAYRSAKYLVQITSGSSYELLELSMIHDGTTVYLSQYGNIKTGATLGVFDATISAGTLSLLATPNNAVTTFKTAATLIPT